MLEQGVVPLSLPFAAFRCFAQRLVSSSDAVTRREVSLRDRDRYISYFPDFGDAPGFAVAAPLGSSWNSLFNC